MKSWTPMTNAERITWRGPTRDGNSVRVSQYNVSDVMGTVLEYLGFDCVKRPYKKLRKC